MPKARAEALVPAIDSPHTPYRLAVTRPPPLAKVQPKSLEMLFYVPPQGNKAWLATDLCNRGGSIAATPGPDPLTLMKAYQYHLVVLCNSLSIYRMLERLDSVEAPHTSNNSDADKGLVSSRSNRSTAGEAGYAAHQRIGLDQHCVCDLGLCRSQSAFARAADGRLAALGWESIISGPKRLDQLRDKAFLGSYSPAAAGAPLSITAEMLGPLNQRWTLPVHEQPGQRLAPASPWNREPHSIRRTTRMYWSIQAAQIKRRLLWRQRVGRGRIIVTAFSLAQRELWS